MSLSDSLTPDQTQARTQYPAAAQEPAAPDQAVQDLFSRTEAALNAEFGKMYGPGGASVRAAFAQAVAAEGPAAYDRLKAQPEAFGAVVGDRARATVLGGTAEALAYSRAYHSAQQEGGGAVVNGSGSQTTDAPDRAQAREARDVGPREVQETIALVRDRLQGRVTHGDLQDIQGAILGLQGPDRTAAMHGLTDENLRSWAREMSDGFVLGGYTPAEQQTLFASLAGGVNARELGRLGRALDATSGTEDNRRLGEAVGAIQSTTKRVEFVRELVTPSVDDTGRRDTSISHGDAVAVAAAVADMSGPGVGRALQGLRSSHFRALFDEGFVARSTSAMGPQYNASGTAQMLRAIATSGDTRLMSEAFTGASTLMHDRDPGSHVLNEPTSPQARSWRSAEQAITSAQTAILGGRENAVVESLKTHDNERAALSRYAQGLLALNQTDTLGRLLTTIQRGDTRRETPAVRYGDNVSGSSTPVQQANAVRLGYAVGSVAAAFDNRTGEERRNIGQIADLVGYVAPGPVADAARRGLEAAADMRGQSLEQARARFEREARPFVSDDVPYSNEIENLYATRQETTYTAAVRAGQ